MWHEFLAAGHGSGGVDAVPHPAVVLLLRQLGRHNLRGFLRRYALIQGLMTQFLERHKIGKLIGPK